MKMSMIGPVTPYRGGIAHFTTLLAKKLVEAGHDVQVISFKKQYPAWLYPGESDKDHSPGREKVDAQFLLTPLNPFSWQKTLRAILDFVPDQVLFPWWVTFWGPAFHFLIKRLNKRGIPVSILIHNTMPHETKPWDRFLARQTLKGADRFIVMTEKEKKRLLNLLPTAQNIQVAPLPIDDSFQKSAFSRDEVRQRLGFQPDQPMILFFGIIRPYKGLAVLLDALKLVVEEKPSVQLWVVGEFWEDKSRTTNQIKDLGLEGHVHLTDRYVPDDEVADFFTAADLFVAPYVDGTQSAALRTALGFGLPVVMTDIIEDELTEDLVERCMVVEAGDDKALAEGILIGLKLTVQDEMEIERLVDHTWEAMIDSAVNQNLSIKKDQVT